MRTIEDIAKRLKESLESMKNNGEDLEHVSWGNEEGILISGQEAEIILAAIEGKRTPTEMETFEQGFRAGVEHHANTPEWANAEWDSEDDEPNGDLFCPNCGAEYDEIDYEFQICHVCLYDNNSPRKEVANGN